MPACYMRISPDNSARCAVTGTGPGAPSAGAIVPLAAAPARCVLAIAVATARVLGSLSRLSRLAQWSTGGDLMLWLKAADIFARQVTLNQLLYAVELFDFISTNE